ncbi:unnamed protein product [Didymodactylos carnosus]|nr:unnamed protein product [Didymodactylos carnosus]CAF4160267.1 unnamed protein product [Didymodactylos carnosus]
MCRAPRRGVYRSIHLLEHRYKSSALESDLFTALDHNDPAFAGVYFYETQEINVLLVGRSQTGKSAIIEALRNPRFRKTKSGFSTTRDPKCYRLVLYVKDKETVYQVNLIDTVGVNEVSKEVDKQWTEYEILGLSRIFFLAYFSTKYSSTKWLVDKSANRQKLVDE